MTQSFFTNPIKVKVSTAARIMSEKQVSRLIVVDQYNKNMLVGIISETDISRTALALKSKTIRSIYENMELQFSSKSKPDFIEPSYVRREDIMTRNTTTIEKDANSTDTAKIMIKQGKGGLSVIESPDNVEQPIGVISKSDMRRAPTTKERAC
jgi:predicted transcriptional regulator